MRTKRTPVQGSLLALAGLFPIMAASAALADDASQTLPDTLVTASRLGTGIVGASTRVITAQDIANDSGTTLPEVLSRVAGVQFYSLYGGVAGTDATIGMRGFGDAPTANTLVLVNGRRINDPDLSDPDFSAIPLDSIERIEVTRGSAGSVLYGDGAVGGVINIVTKNGFNETARSHVDVGYGSFGQKQIDATTSQTFGHTAISASGSILNSDGYRDNNALRERNFVGEARQGIDNGEVYINLRADDQHLGLPGGLPITGTSQPANPKAAGTPNDWAKLNSESVSFGGDRFLDGDMELVVDGGLRHKEQDFEYAGYTEYESRQINIFSLTPRLVLDKQSVFGLPAHGTVGIDVYDASFHAKDSASPGAAAYDGWVMTQVTSSIYGQETVALRSDTDLTAGLRLENMDVWASGNPYGMTNTSLAHDKTLPVVQLGLEHRLNQDYSLFGRVGHSVRLPNVDERSGTVLANFALQPQTSNDVEAGAKIKLGGFDAQASAYFMRLHDEIDFDPGANGGYGADVNLSPTQRAGGEIEAGYRLSPEFRLHGSLAYVRATFVGGPYNGNTVPLVSPWTGDVGASYAIVGKLLQLDTDLRGESAKRFGDDMANSYPQEPAYAVLDVKLHGEWDRFDWSLTGSNILNSHYYDQGWVAGNASAVVYPLPGRTFLGKVGVQF